MSGWQPEQVTGSCQELPGVAGRGPATDCLSRVEYNAHNINMGQGGVGGECAKDFQHVDSWLSMAVFLLSTTDVLGRIILC